MNKREYILRNEKVFVGLEDSKRTWKLCVRSGGMMVHETSMPARYEMLRNYFNNKFPECQIQVVKLPRVKALPELMLALDSLAGSRYSPGWQVESTSGSRHQLGRREGGPRLLTTCIAARSPDVLGREWYTRRARPYYRIKACIL